jgi:predicted RNA-binding Zn-ribbon protein involved in translation (DUF1610 family)
MKRKMSDEHKRKISDALKGKKPKNLDWLHEQSKGKGKPGLQNENNSRWKGENARYGSKHAWMRRKFGTPSKCELCGTEDAAKYEWHNVNGEYRREREDWQRLCVSCHRKITFEGLEPWNKGRKIRTNTGRTHIRPGEHISAATEFKPGLVPHNKYLEPKACAQCGEMFQPREANRKFCSYRCYWDSLKRKPPQL